jgi:hypothetical protein
VYVVVAIVGPPPLDAMIPIAGTGIWLTGFIKLNLDIWRTRRTDKARLSLEDRR